MSQNQCTQGSHPTIQPENTKLESAPVHIRFSPYNLARKPKMFKSGFNGLKVVQQVHFSMNNFRLDYSTLSKEAPIGGKKQP